MELHLARSYAESAIHDLSPFCTRCEIAGSIRRQKPEVGDIEIVAIPRGRDLASFKAQVDRWRKVKGEATGRYTQRRLPCGIALDLFMATPENWGLIFAIRTGSADFSHHFLASGWVKAGLKSEGGMLRRNGQPVPVREERELFDLISLAWVPPQERL